MGVLVNVINGRRRADREIDRTFARKLASGIAQKNCSSHGISKNLTERVTPAPSGLIPR